MCEFGHVILRNFCLLHLVAEWPSDTELSIRSISSFDVPSLLMATRLLLSSCSPACGNRFLRRVVPA